MLNPYFKVYGSNTDMHDENRNRRDGSVPHDTLSTQQSPHTKGKKTDYSSYAKQRTLNTGNWSLRHGKN